MSLADYERAIEALGEMMRLAQDADDERDVRELAEELHARALCAGFGALVRERRRAAA